MTLKNLKKKLFIAGAYLLIFFLLLLYVSYSAYRIHIAADVIMPQVIPAQAGLTVSCNLADGKTVDAQGIVLNGLQPGEKVSTASDATERIISVTVKNSTVSEVSKLPQRFKIYVEETGPIPLEIILTDDEDPSFSAKAKTTVIDNNYDKIKVAGFAKEDGSEPVFSIGANDNEQHSFKLHFGWNNDIKVHSSTIRKELATVNIRVELTGLPPVATEGEAPPLSTASDIKPHVYHATPTNAQNND